MSEAALGWRRISRGLYLVGFGVLLLLTTHDRLGIFFWIEAASLWPLLLVALGIRLIFERSRTPWLILLSPLVVFSTLSWLALTHPDHALEGWDPVPAEATGPADRWTFTGRMAMVRLDLRSEPMAPGRLVEGRVSGGWAGSPRVRTRGGEARVEMGGWRRWRIGVLVPGVTQAWDLTLSRDLPMTLALEGAFSAGDVDLVGASPSRIDLEGAFHRIRFRLGQPEQDVRFDIDGAFNDIDIVVPASTPVSVTAEGGINVTESREHPPRAEGPGYRLRVHGLMNHVEILSDPDASAPSDEEARPAGGADLPPAPAGS